jgi:hypothetical protein
MDLPAKLFSILARWVNFLRFFYCVNFCRLVIELSHEIDLAFDDMKC